MPGPADLGFAEFVSSLLRETAAAVVSAHTEQEERLRDLAESAALSPEEFTALLPPEQVQAALAAVLPDGKGGTSAVEGGPAPDDDVLAALELTLRKEDVKSGRLTAAGALQVRDAVALHLAERQVSALREASRFGVPRVVVDGGKVSAKLTYSVVETTPAASSNSPASGPASGPAPAPAGPARLLPGALPVDPRLARLRPALAARLPSALAGVRLQVRPASADVVQDSTVRADVFGEVSFTYRTVL